jgi:4-hydroxy-tetrahydrodipicolinate synthase
MFSEPSPAPVKAALSLKGMMSDAVRPPLTSASAGCRENLAAVMAAFEAT